MNTIFRFDYLEERSYQALRNDQSLTFMRSCKIRQRCRIVWCL